MASSCSSLSGLTPPVGVIKPEDDVSIFLPGPVRSRIGVKASGMLRPGATFLASSTVTNLCFALLGVLVPLLGAVLETPPMAALRRLAAFFFFSSSSESSQLSFASTFGDSTAAAAADDDGAGEDSRSVVSVSAGLSGRLDDEAAACRRG